MMGDTRECKTSGRTVKGNGWHLSKHMATNHGPKAKSIYPDKSGPSNGPSHPDPDQARRKAGASKPTPMSVEASKREKEPRRVAAPTSGSVHKTRYGQTVKTEELVYGQPGYGAYSKSKGGKVFIKSKEGDKYVSRHVSVKPDYSMTSKRSHKFQPKSSNMYRCDVCGAPKHAHDEKFVEKARPLPTKSKDQRNFEASGGHGSSKTRYYKSREL